MAEKQSEIDRIPPPEGLEASKLPAKLSPSVRTLQENSPRIFGTWSGDHVLAGFLPGKISRETRNELRVIYSMFRETGYRRVWRPPAVSGGSGKSPERLSNVRWSWFYLERSEFRSFRESSSTKVGECQAMERIRRIRRGLRWTKRRRVLKFETISNISTSTTEV